LVVSEEQAHERAEQLGQAEQVVGLGGGRPRSHWLNPQVACVLPLMCHENEETAIERGLDGAHFFGYALAHYYVFGAHRPGRTSIWEEFQHNRARFGFDRQIAAQTGVQLGAQLLQEGLGSLRGAIGTPTQIRELIGGYQAAGVDQLVFVSQAGRTRHEHICESLELFADQVLPEFAEQADQLDHDKAQRLQGAVEAALARREPPRTPPDEYTIPPAPQF
jgi:alkanesulfonate monooxygenase SsuD/methylene tetrahydromethanopterin reductase-like flavin-dependent oxidoreductase (luciferase family)